MDPLAEIPRPRRMTGSAAIRASMPMSGRHTVMAMVFVCLDTENAYRGDTQSVRRREHDPWHMYAASTTSGSRSQISMS